MLAVDFDSSKIGNNNGSGTGKKSSESVAKPLMNVNMFLMGKRRAMRKLNAYPKRYTSSDLSLSKSVFNGVLDYFRGNELAFSAVNCTPKGEGTMLVALIAKCLLMQDGKTVQLYGGARCVPGGIKTIRDFVLQLEQ